MSIVYRQDKTDRLTTKEVDANFKYIGEVDENIQSGILYFHKPAGRVHGTASSPIITNLLIDKGTPEEDNEAVEGGMVEVIWQGSVNPNITGVAAADILNIGETIITQGIYSIFIMYTGGKYKVNIQSPQGYVGDGDALQDPDQPTGETLATITVTDPAVSETLATITVTDSVETLATITVT